MVQQIDVHMLAEKLAAAEPVHLLDVRQPEEHEHVALPGSQLIPLSELAARAEEIQVAEGTLIVVYCHHGIRSLSGAAILSQIGFAKVASLRGGIDAWSLAIDPGLRRY